MGELRSWQAFLPLEPPTVTHNDLEAYMRRGRGGRLVPSIRKSAALHDAEERIAARVRAAGPPAEPLSGALREEVRLCFAPRAGRAQGSPMADKPDLDNSIKTINDVLERERVIANDSRVVELLAAKAWSDPAGIYVRVEEIGGDC